MKNELLYLACPYRHEDLAVQKKRIAAVAFAAKELFLQGRPVFSPLTHNDFFCRLYPEIEKEQWMQFDLSILAGCTTLAVLKLDGWEQSKGVRREIDFAQQRGLPIEYLEPSADEQIAHFLNPSHTQLLNRMVAFNQARAWDPFHSPKNLAIDVASEVGEILDHFKWITEEQSKALPPDTLAKVREEIGDALRSLLYLSLKLGIDPIAAAEDKLPILEQRYPVAQAKGSNRKYTAYQL